MSMYIISFTWVTIQVPLITSLVIDGGLDPTSDHQGAYCCSCGIRQELSRAMDEIARLRSELLDEKSNRDGHMVEIEAKVNDILNIVATLLKKEMKKYSRTVVREEQNVGGHERSTSVGSEGLGKPQDRSLSSSKKEDNCVGHSTRPSPSTTNIRVDQVATYLGKSKMSPTEGSGELGFKAKMKRKKAHKIPLSSLRKDREAFDQFNNSSGFVVRPFVLRFPFRNKTLSWTNISSRKAYPMVK